MFQAFDIWKLLAGLGIFMFGMFLMEESIRKLSGRAFKRLIREYTSGKFKSVFSGIFVTSILQSSSAVSLMVLAFTGAGIMTMESAIGVMLGSNVGTTMTSWIVATFGFKLDIESFALPLIGAGGLGIIFLGRSEKYSNISKLLVGFGFLFMGLNYMKQSVEVFTDNFDISSFPDYGLIVYLLVGILLTALMQSSSAAMAIILTALSAQIIEFDSAASLVIGANVGTTVTVLLGSIGAIQIKKRVAYSHFVFNFITAVIASVIMPFLVYLILDVFDMRNNMIIGLALFHTMFNLLGVIFFLPFINLLSNLMIRIVPDTKIDLNLFINKTPADVPEAAIPALKNETLHLIQNALHYNLRILTIDHNLVVNNIYETGTNTSKNKLSLDQQYNNLKLLQAAIFTYAAAIQSHEVSEHDAHRLHRYLHGARMALHSTKTLKDVKHNFEDFENADNVFLNEQYGQFKRRLIATYLGLAQALQENDIELATNYLEKVSGQLKKDDKIFVSATTRAISKKEISDIDVSNALIVNRAFIQSSKQMLKAIREVVLTSTTDEDDKSRAEIVESVQEDL